MLSWHGGMNLCLMTALGLLGAQENTSDDIIAKLKATAAAHRAQEAEKAKARNSLDREIGTFSVEQCPLHDVVYAIHHLGINICHETVAGKVDAYIDAEGVSAFGSDRPISIKLTGATVRQILDRICEADPRYAWTDDEKHGLVVLAPKENGRLQFAVGPIKEHGNPYNVLGRISRSADVEPFGPGVIRGNHFPDIALDSPRCTATELLNQIVAQHPGMTWSFGGSVSFSYLRNTTAEAVRIEFPSVRKGTPTNGWWIYSIVERRLDGVWTMTVEKHKLKVPFDFTGPAPPPQLVAAAAAAAAREKEGDVRTQEQNVVASRLAGSWKIEAALSERLTGRATALNSTLSFVADPEVKGKVPARFLEAAKKEGNTIEIRLAGYLEVRGAKQPFILTTYQGNPHVFYFRERGGDPFGDSESFNVMLAPAKDRKNDLLFIGGDFNNQPFVAYGRTDAEK